MTIRPGQSAVHAFTVTGDAMRAFQTLSGDMSKVHTDPEFARARGFKDVIVYGGILLAQLSHVLGMKLPGTEGTSTRWTVDYRVPLYVDEPATLALEIVNTSPATGLVDAKFVIAAAGRTIATGTAQTLAPREALA